MTIVGITRTSEMITRGVRLYISIRAIILEFNGEIQEKLYATIYGTCVCLITVRIRRPKVIDIVIDCFGRWRFLRDTVCLIADQRIALIYYYLHIF